MVPAAALPLAAPSTDQATAGLLDPLTVALKLWLVPPARVTEPGLMVTPPAARRVVAGPGARPSRAARTRAGNWRSPGRRHANLVQGMATSEFLPLTHGGNGASESDG